MTIEEQNKNLDQSNVAENSINSDVEENKTIAALGYLWILFLIPLITKPKSKFAQFHAKQALVLFILSFATIVPFLGLFLFLILTVVSVISIIKSYNGEWWKIPFVYDLSKKIKL